MNEPMGAARVILAVDDSASMRRMVSATLTGAGYEVVAAEDGAEALQYARDHRVDLVVTDVNMPRMDGLTLVRELRRLPSYRSTPILVLTNQSSPARRKAGQDAGASEWMVKPFNPVQLLDTIARLL